MDQEDSCFIYLRGIWTKKTRAHHYFVSCFFYLLGANVSFVSGSKGPVRHCANIAYMCLKSFVIVTPRSLNIFYLFVLLLFFILTFSILSAPTHLSVFSQSTGDNPQSWRHTSISAKACLQRFRGQFLADPFPLGMPSPILWYHVLKMQRTVLLNSILWWELGNHWSWWMIVVSAFHQ